MDPMLMVMANVAGGVVFFGGIALLVWMDHRAKLRRRELEHLERMKAIELDRPLDDAAVARHKALGAIGVATPIAAMSAASLGSFAALSFPTPELKFGAFAVNWTVCGAACVAGILVISLRLRDRPPPSETDATE